MRVTGDLGFSSLVLVVVCLVIPVIGFVIRRKWQLAVAREEEIRRLLFLAAEEAARAELDASYNYATTVSVSKNNQCAVCYCPTTTRCARCKAVRYCSGKCQIIHWRQGHKEECHPPNATYWSDDVVSDLGQKVAEQAYGGIHGEKSEIEGTQHKTSSKKSLLSDNSCSPEVSCKTDDDTRVDPLVEENITHSNSELLSSPFSGFSASTSASESSDDASACESIISNEHERSEGHVFVDTTLDMLDTTSSDIVGARSSLSPKFASLVDSVDDFSTMHRLHQFRHGLSKEERNLASNGTSGSSMCNRATTEPSTMPSGFWDKTLGAREIKNDADATNDPFPCHSNEFIDYNESGYGSSFHNTLQPWDTRGPDAKRSVSDNTFSNYVRNNMPSVGLASSDNDVMHSSIMRNSSSTMSKESQVINFATTSGSDQLKSSKDNCGPPISSTDQPSSIGKDSDCAGASSINHLQSAGTKASIHNVDNPVYTSHHLKSVEARCLPRAVADAQFHSRTERHSHSSTKCANNGVQSGSPSPSQVASCSPNSKSGLKTSLMKVVDQFKGSSLSKRFPLAVSSDTVGRYNDKGLFSYELFVKLYNWNKVDLQPFGLINCGNSCYANAVLQCLVFTPPLTAYLLQGCHSKACANKKWCFTCEFESLIFKSKDMKSALSPMGILTQLQNMGSQLGNGREEDAHEFLRHAIDTMQSICLMEAGIDASGSFEEETTLVGLTFGGYLRSKIKCMKCGGKSEHQERMMDLTVEIEGEIATLEEALKRFTSTETLDGENEYHCVRCKSYEKAKKKLTVSEAPNVLTIALKRFQSGKFGKLNKSIQFPEILDLAPFMSGTSDKSPIYRLYGVVVHLDVMSAAFSGHYVCYVKNIQNKWFKVDDSVVTPVDLERVLTKGAYILLYARCSPRAPKLIRNMIVSSDLKSKAVYGKTSTMKSRSVSTGAAECFISPISPDGSPNLDSVYSKFRHLKRILEEDSSSDNSSLISSNSDEGSCSTDSTFDSTSADDFSDYIFGDSGHGWNSIWRNSDSDTSSSSSSSPLDTRHSPLADIDRYDSRSPDATGLRTPVGSSTEIDGPLYRLSTGVSRPVSVGREGGVSLRYSDTSIQHRKVDSSRKSSSSFRETDSFQRRGSDQFINDRNTGVSCSKSRERSRTD